jgi:tripartite-type tricarboxylate transporter receptor subunit TctC
MMDCRTWRFLPGLLAVLFLASCSNEQATGGPASDTGEHTFAGETITVVIGLDASAGGTTIGRFLSKHLETHLPGDPTVIVNNMPGAGGLNAQLHVLLRAPKDGTTIYYGPRSSLGELLQLPGVTFKYSQFTPLGGIQIGGLVVYARTDSIDAGVSGPEDVVGTDPLRFGGMPPEHGRMIVSTMGLDLIGANYRYIAGYPSSGNIRAAVISGEVNTATDASHAYLRQVVPVLMDDGSAVPLFSIPELTADGALVPNAMVPEVPSLEVLYEQLNGTPPSGTLWDAIMTMLEIDQTMQHGFMGPPDMDPAAAATIRAALEQAMASTAFAEEAIPVLGYVPRHVNHGRQAEVLAATSRVSPEVLEYIRAHIEKNSQY